MTFQELNEYVRNGCYSSEDDDCGEDGCMRIITFGEPRRLNICPASKQLVISKNRGAFALLIKNLLVYSNASEADYLFYYNISFEDRGSCLNEEEDLEKLIVLGKTVAPIRLLPGEDFVSKVVLNIPKDFEDCVFRYKIQVFYEEDKRYAVEFVDVTVKR